MKDARYAHVTNDARLPAHRMRLVENTVDNMRETCATASAHSGAMHTRNMRIYAL